MFKSTQTSQAMQLLQANITAINRTFNVEWSKLVWKNLTIPLYSALAARLYLVQTTGFHAFPRSIEEQAAYWHTNYRTNGSEERFINATKRLEKGIVCLLERYMSKLRRNFFCFSLAVCQLWKSSVYQNQN